MGQVTIYGASDDLIEVDGDFSEEYAYNDGKTSIVVVGEDGAVTQVTPVLSENWTVGIKTLRGGNLYEVVKRKDDDLAAQVKTEGTPIVLEVIG